MTSTAAAWVREQVWPPIWLRNHNHIPSTTFACACTGPPSLTCQRDDHGACQEDGRRVRHETVIQTSSDRPARFDEPYEHYSPVVSGRNVLAWVWLSGRPCREICTCFCHRPNRPLPPAATATPEQLDLFAGAP